MFVKQNFQCALEIIIIFQYFKIQHYEDKKFGHISFCVRCFECGVDLHAADCVKANVNVGYFLIFMTILCEAWYNYAL